MNCEANHKTPEGVNLLDYGVNLWCGMWRQRVGFWSQRVGFWSQRVGLWSQRVGLWSQRVGLWRHLALYYISGTFLK